MDSILTYFSKIQLIFNIFKNSFNI